MDHESVQTILSEDSPHSTLKPVENENEASPKTARLIEMWIKEGAITPQDLFAPEWKVQYFPVEIDLDMIGIVRDNESPSDNNNSQDVLPGEELREISQYVIKSLVQANIVPPNLAILVGRNLRPSDIVSRGDRTKIDYSLYDGPDELADLFSLEDKRPEEYLGFNKPDEISILGSTEFEELINTLGIKNEINLSSAELSRLSKLALFAHEYGHSIHNALARKLARNKIEENPNLNPSETATAATTALCMQIYDNYPLPSIVREVLERGRKCSVFSRPTTSIERIPRTLERAILDIELQKMGIDKEYIDSFLFDLSDEFSRRFIERFLHLNNTAEEYCMHLPDILECLNRHRNQRFKDPNAQAAVGYSTVYIGYGAALTTDELKEWLADNSNLFAEPDSLRRPQHQAPQTMITQITSE